MDNYTCDWSRAFQGRKKLICRMYSAICILLMAILPRPGFADNANEGFADNTNDTVEPFIIQPSIEKMVLRNTVIVKNSKGVGSGFICKMDGEKWLVTNEHVARSIRTITAQYVEDGKKVSFEPSEISKKEKDVFIEVASDRDLVRIKVKDVAGQREGLIASDDIFIEKQVKTYGNSDGAGVVTSLSGRVLGIGPDSLEVDIPFVQGNSGGAIVDSDGHVAGVVTYATINNDPENWMKTGTRFNKVRRFGVRLNGIKWVKMRLSDYTDRCLKMQEFDVCQEFMFSLCIKPLESIDAWIKLYSYKPSASKWSVINKVRKDIGWMKDSVLRNAILDIYSNVFEAEPKIVRLKFKVRDKRDVIRYLDGTEVICTSPAEFAEGDYVRVPYGYEAKLQNAIQMRIGMAKRRLQNFKAEYWKIGSLKSEREGMLEVFELLELYMKDDSKDGFRRHFTHYNH